MHVVTGLTGKQFSHTLPEQGFEVGAHYLYYIKNDPYYVGRCILPDSAPLGQGVLSVCTEDGSDAENVKNPILLKYNSFGQTQKYAYVIEEGYHLIQVFTPDGFDELLGKQYSPEVVISKVERLNFDISLNMFTMQIVVLDKFKESDFTFLDFLTEPVMKALIRLHLKVG
ncbi:hypothetical protein D3C71_1245070 [compost metagenome]